MPATTPNLKIPYPVPDDSVDVPRDMKAMADAIDPVSQQALPAGVIMMWQAAAAPPGWKLLGPNATVPADTNPGLAAIYGQTNNVVSLPDFTDRFPAGAGANNGALKAPGPAGFGNNGLAAASVPLALNQMPKHSHSGRTGYRIPGDTQVHNHRAGSRWMLTDVQGVLYPGPGAGMTPAEIVIESTDAPDHRHIITEEGGNAGHENRPPFLTVNFIIKLG